MQKFFKNALAQQLVRHLNVDKRKKPNKSYFFGNFAQKSHNCCN